MSEDNPILVIIEYNDYTTIVETGAEPVIVSEDGTLTDLILFAVEGE